MNLRFEAPSFFPMSYTLLREYTRFDVVKMGLNFNLLYKKPIFALIIWFQ